MASTPERRGAGSAPTDDVTFGFVVPTYGEYADPGRIAALVEAGERLGYDDIWFGDRAAVPTYALPFTDPAWYEALACAFTALGATRRIRVGTDVLVLPYREPLLLARQLATAQLLSGGRFVLGVGVGYLRGEFEALGVDYDARGATTDEFLEVLEAAWAAEGPVSHDGPTRSFADVHTGPRPPGGRVPVWVGGNHARALARVARHGDGWHPLFPTPEAYRAGRARIEELRAELGRPEPAGGFAWSYSCPETKVLERPEASSVSYTHDVVGEVPADFAYAPPVPATEEGRPRFLGTAEQVTDDVSRFVAAGVRHFTLRFWAGSPGFDLGAFTAQLEAFSEGVAARFRA